MKLFVLSEVCIRDIINRLTVEDKIKKILDEIILRFDYSYGTFIYSLFSVYTTYYVNLLDENSHLNYHEAEEIFNKLTKTNLSVDRSNVFIADIFDILYVGSSFEKTRFNSYFYEDFYNRLEHMLGVQNATDNMEEIFSILENIFSTVEETIVFNLASREETNSNIVFYLELTPHGLMIYLV